MLAALVPFDALTAVVITANVLGGAMALPQVAKLIRTRQVDGVSATWAGVSATVNSWWAVYGFGIGDLGIVPVSIVSVIAYLAIAAALVRFRRTSVGAVLTPMLLGAGAVAVIPAIALVASGWTAAGVTLGTLYGVQLAPAVIAVYRSSDVRGVAAATWALAWVEAALWGVYGFARADLGLLTLAVTGGAMSSLVLLRLFARRPLRTTGNDTVADDRVGELALSPA